MTFNFKSYTPPLNILQHLPQQTPVFEIYYNKKQRYWIKIIQVLSCGNNNGEWISIQINAAHSMWHDLELQDYILKGHQLTSETSSKYLGVELQSDMSWRSHINKTVKKANSTLGCLRRNLKVSNQDTKTAAYKSLVRTTIEYCSSA